MSLRFDLGSSLSLVLALAAALVGAMACDRAKNNFPGRDAATVPSLQGDGGALQVQIKGSPNNCPAVTVAVSPPDAKVNDELDVNATAVDPDPSDQITLSWTATGGSFANAKVEHTTYTCSAVGPQTITLAVSDGRCTVSRTVAIYCYARGVQTGSGGAAGGGMTGTGGTGGGSGVAGSGGRGPGTGGAGPGSGTGGAAMAACMGSLTMQVTHSEGETCEMCTDVNCSPSTDGCDIVNNNDSGLTSDTEIQQCRRLYCCILVNQCSEFGDPTRCLCGTDQNVPCGAPNGPCVAEFRAAAHSTDPATIKLRFIDPGYPLGRANNLASCRGAFCGRQNPDNPVSPEYVNTCMVH